MMWPLGRGTRRCLATASGFHSVNALTGAAAQLRHDAQWQNPCATGSPVPHPSSTTRSPSATSVNMTRMNSAEAVTPVTTCRTSARPSTCRPFGP